MSENSAESLRAREPKEDPAKNFNKVRFLQIQGLLTREFSNGKLDSQSSWSLRFLLYLSLASKLYFALKPTISNFFPRNDIAQLIIGNCFNLLPDKPKMFIGVTVGGLIAN